MEKQYKIKRKYIFREVENEAVVLVPETDTLFALSESAKIVWEEMMQHDGIVSHSRIEEILRSVYQVDEQLVKEDVKSFVANMIKNELFEEINV